MNIKKRHIYMLKRKQKKITHKEVAEAIGASQSAISQHETGRTTLRPQRRQAYEDYIDNKVLEEAE